MNCFDRLKAELSASLIERWRTQFHLPQLREERVEMQDLTDEFISAARKMVKVTDQVASLILEKLPQDYHTERVGMVVAMSEIEKLGTLVQAATAMYEAAIRKE
jgi:hypothetical protein